MGSEYKKEIKNPFKKFLTNICLGIFLLIFSFGGISLCGQIFNSAKVEDDVDAIELSTQVNNVWIATYRKYNKYGNAYDLSFGNGVLVGKIAILDNTWGQNSNVGAVSQVSALITGAHDIDTERTYSPQTMGKRIQDDSGNYIHIGDYSAFGWKEQPSLNVLDSYPVVKYPTSYYNYLGSFIASIQRDSYQKVYDAFYWDTNEGRWVLTENNSLSNSYNSKSSNTEQTKVSGNYTFFQTKSGAQSSCYVMTLQGKSSTITLNKQSGSGGTSSVTAYYGDYLPKLTSLPTKSGSYFAGYYTGTNGTGIKWYNADGTPTGLYTGISNVTLYAKWETKNPVSYLCYDWKTLLTSANLNYTAANIMTINFTNTQPSGTPITVGATAIDGDTTWSSNANCYNVEAYVTTNSTNSSKYDIVFYSPYSIYFPERSDSLFGNLTNCTSIDFGTNIVDTSEVFNMLSMFENCSKLTTLNVTSFITSEVITMDSMFYGCSSLKSLDLTNFNTSKVSLFNFMFYGCSSIVELDLSNFNLTSLTATNDVSSVFDNMTNLNEIKLPYNVKVSIDLPNSNFYNASTLAGPYSAISSSVCSSSATNTTTLAQRYTVTFEPNGGEVGETSRYVYYNQPYGTLPTPTKTGYVFNGWFKESTLKNRVDSLSKVTATADHTLYANWIDNVSYLYKNWKTSLTNVSSDLTAENINTIKFTKTQPTTGTAVSVGASSSAGGTPWGPNASCYDVEAYVTANSADSSKYDIEFYSSYPIYFPTGCSDLFSGLTNCTLIDFGIDVKLILPM